MKEHLQYTLTNPKSAQASFQRSLKEIYNIANELCGNSKDPNVCTSELPTNAMYLSLAFFLFSPLFSISNVK